MEVDERRKWTLLSSHGHVLVEIARNPRARVRDISAIIGITERATQAIIADLERAGYVERLRIGRLVLHARGKPVRERQPHARQRIAADRGTQSL